MYECEFADCDLPADVYVDGCGQVDNLGVNFRAIYFVYQRGPGGIITRVPVVSLVRPKGSIGEASRARTTWAQQADPHSLMLPPLNS